MSHDNICRDCEYKRVDDALLCSECAEDGFLDLMRSNANKRWEVLTGSYYFDSVAEVDKQSNDVFEAWVEHNPEKAGQLLFKLFDQALENYQFEGEV